MRLRLRKTSLVDYPGKVAAVVFVPGCNLRCPWCHNPELVLPGGEDQAGEAPYSPEEALDFLKKRRPVLGGVVVSGGEPCLWEDLPPFIGGIKSLGFPVKLDTNGTVPAMLEKLFREEAYRPDYVALDLKLAPSRYGELVPPSPEPPSSPGDRLRESAALIRLSGVAHEYRSVALPGGFITGEDIEALSPLVDGGPWYFRPFRGGNCLERAWDLREESPAQARARAETLAQRAQALGKKGIVPSRGP